MSLLEVWAFADEWSPRVLVAGLVMTAVGIAGIVRHRRKHRHVSGRPQAAFAPGVARVGDPVPSSDEDLLDVAYATDVVQAVDR